MKDLSSCGTRLCVLAMPVPQEPQVLILDEPASGLDPRARVEIRDILKQVARLSVTVVISSHVLSELEQLCTHIGIIEQGKLRRWGEMATVLEAARPRKAWRLRLAGMTDAALARLRQVDGVLRVEVTAGEYVIELDAERLRQRGQRLDAIPGEIVETLVGAGVGIQSCTEDRASLEDAFLTFTQGLLA